MFWCVVLIDLQGGTKTTSGVSKVVPFKSPGSHSMKKNR